MAERPSQSAVPQPNIVQSFSQDLDSMFGLDPGVGHLEQTVEQKKQIVTSGHQQLQELEARLRETEERLARVSRGSSPARQADTGASTTEPTQQQQQQHSTEMPGSTSLRPPAAVRPQAAARGETAALMAGMPGTIPQTPREHSGNSEYVMVDRNTDRSERGYGQSVR
ncbi:hypothetical protein B0A55_04446 [Friedmanniomyces simplex]|uniref:Uncharacterized protein n=1 Tax=Friedmanniomyces simplex TaxID=329884 RepID=A0A4U0XGD5_9PEZI|nr:hypothetical protein B0A55_04446 [Friedmanniomyces simplex]